MSFDAVIHTMEVGTQDGSANCPNTVNTGAGRGGDKLAVLNGRTSAIIIAHPNHGCGLSVAGRAGRQTATYNGILERYILATNLDAAMNIQPRNHLIIGGIDLVAIYHS